MMTDYLSKGSTATGAYYADELLKLREALKTSIEESCDVEFFCSMITRLPTPALMRRLLRLNVVTNYYLINHIRQI